MVRLTTLTYILVLLGLLCVLLIHILRADVHGHTGMLPSHAQTSLGGVLEQVLQGYWIQIHSLLLRTSSQGANEQVRDKIFLLRSY